MSRDMTKPTKWLCARRRLRSALGIRSVWSESSLSAFKKVWVLSYPLSTSEDWSDWADAQADLSVRKAHTHFVDFVMSWLVIKLKHFLYAIKVSSFLILNCFNAKLYLIRFEVSSALFLLITKNMSGRTTNLTKCPANIQINLGIWPVWSESLMCALWVARDSSLLLADSEDSDWTVWMPRLIWVFAGPTGHFVGFVMLGLRY